MFCFHYSLITIHYLLFTTYDNLLKNYRRYASRSVAVTSEKEHDFLKTQMKLSKYLALILVILSGAVIFRAQTNEILATANGQNYTVKDLDPATREAFEGLNKAISSERTEALGQQVAELLFQEEAALKKMTVDKLLETEVPKRMTAPTAAEIKAVYDANRDQIGGATLEQVQPQIVNFLERQSYPNALSKYVGELRVKHKVIFGKDVNAANLVATDVLATVNAKTVTVKEFEEKAGQQLYEVRAGVYDKTYDYLETIIFNELIGLEAKKLNLDTSDLLAREITDKMKDFSEEEREKLEADFRARIAQKYGIRIMLNEPEPFVHKISADDDPAQGSATAPVTIVMFSDFQCPACAKSHPLLKKVIAEYPGRIRFVVRDYPLTQNHKDAFQAAVAANAAHQQGKFFEYTELLYNNQDSLDTASLKRFAAELGLDQQKFNTDLESGKFADEVKKDMTDGDQYGVNSTPTIFVNGVKVRSLSAQAFRKAINRALKK
jgi:protein-disulfide isomerase